MAIRSSTSASSRWWCLDCGDSASGSLSRPGCRPFAGSFTSQQTRPGRGKDNRDFPRLGFLFMETQKDRKDDRQSVGHNLFCGLLVLEHGEEFFQRGGEDFVLFVNRGKWAVEVFPFQGHLDQGLLAHFLRDLWLRHDGPARLDLNRAFYGLDVVELHDRLHADLGFFEEAIDGAPSGNVSFELNEFLSLQL